MHGRGREQWRRRIEGKKARGSEDGDGRSGGAGLSAAGEGSEGVAGG